MAAVAMAFSLSYAQDELREITTDGTASILNTDKAMARDVAIQDALRNAVEQVTGAVISSSTVVENAMVMEDNIYSKAKGYVKAYSVLSEGEADNGMTYNVKVKAQVRAGAIKDDIGDILRGAGNPRLMVLITEQNIGQHQYSGLDVNLNVAENAIMENMRNKGFEFVDQEANERNMRKDKALAAMQGDAAAAAFIGDRAGAEVIIVTGDADAMQLVDDDVKVSASTPTAPSSWRRWPNCAPACPLNASRQSIRRSRRTPPGTRTW